MPFFFKERKDGQQAEPLCVCMLERERQRESGRWRGGMEYGVCVCVFEYLYAHCRNVCMAVYVHVRKYVCV